MSHSGSGNETSEGKSFGATRSDVFFQRIYQQAATGIAITDWLGVFQECNSAYCALLGYTEEELRSVDFASLVHPDDREANLAQVSRLQSGEISSFDIENRYIHKNGAPVWVHKLVSVLPGENGEPAHLIALVTNTTGPHHAEQMLRASEAKLRLALDASDAGTWSWEARTDQTQWDERYGSMYGIPGETPRHETWVACIHPEDRPRVLARINEVRNTPGDDIWNVEFRAIRPDGIVTWMQSLGRAARDANGQLLSLSGINVDITERKRTEEALRVVSAELGQTLHTAGTGLYHCSRDLRYLSANPAYAELMGLHLEQIVGRPMVEVMGQAAFEIIRPHIERVLSGERVEYEDELPIAGERKWIRAVYTPDQDASGNVVGGVASVIDITARKRAEEELKAANAFLDAIIENIPLMLFIKESQSLRFVRLNRAAEDLLGWPNQTLIGKNAYDYWPKEQADFFVEKDRETLQSGRIVDIPEEPIETRNRGVRILHTKKVPILDTANKPIYLLGISDDITERKRIEKEQRFLAEVGVALSFSLEYEQTLVTMARLVVQNIADWCAVDVMDEQGQLSRLKVASADPDQGALCTVLEQMPPDRDLPHLMRSVIESKRPIVVEQVTLQYIESLAQGSGHLQALLATGTISLVAVPLLMRGQSLGALVFTSSTPSHVYGQSDLRLGEALAERAAMAIENARLYRASVRASQLRDQTLSIVAHDLRNPLATILMHLSTQKLRSPKLERRSQNPAEGIHRAAKHMDRLIQDLLDVTLVEAGQLNIERSRLSPGGLIVEAVDMQRPLVSSSSLEIRVEVDPHVPEVQGDRDRLLQVFENLIGNAIKFTQPGGRITAGASSRDDEVVFWIADTGCGIAAENLGRLFDRFWQASRGWRRGSGLGLVITKGIVEAHGGRIWVESTAGSGSTFLFTIPRASAAQDKLSDRP